MKKTLSFLAQTMLFFVVLLAGTLLDPFHLKWFVTHPTLTSTRFFVPDGVLLATLLLLLIFAAEAGSKRLRTAGAITSAAYVAALVLGLLVKVGWATHDLF